MEKIENLLTLTIVSLIVAIASGCRIVDEEPRIPNPGFAIYSTARSINGFERILPFARTQGQVGVSYFG
jgi:hypothetical protein